MIWSWDLKLSFCFHLQKLTDGMRHHADLHMKGECCQEQIHISLFKNTNASSTGHRCLFYDEKTASQFRFGTCSVPVSRGSKSAAVILPHYGQTKHGYKVKVQSEKMSASHLSSQPVTMTG